MSIETKKTELTKDSYATAGAGALVGGASAYGVINAKLTHLAKETVDAFSGKAVDCDAFVKKHDDIISRAVDSKKGFFGKINKAINDISKTNGDDAIDAIAKSTSDVVDSYRNLATRKLNTQLSGEELSKGVDNLSNKLISKDVLKSLKNVTKFENIVKVAGFAAIGAIGACVLKEVVKTVKQKKAEKQQEKPVEKIAIEKTEKKDTAKKAKKAPKARKGEKLFDTKKPQRAAKKDAETEKKAKKSA